MPNDALTWEVTMAGVAVLAVVSLFGIVATIAWIVLVSMGIHREDRHRPRNAPGSLGGVAPGRASRAARHATGVHWA
jgi:hypothetical protein